MRTWILLALVCLVTSVRAEAQTNYGRIRTDGISNKQTITIIGPTPSVSVGNVFITGNSGATSITNFTGGTDSQQIIVICGDANTTIANNSNIVIAAGANITCAVNATYQFAYNAGLGKWLQTASRSGATVAGNNGDLQCRSGTTLASCGDVANGPAYVRYISATGKDSNSGLNWENAKATIWNAMLSLPNATSNTAGQGTIYVSQGAAVGNPVTGMGINLIGPNDSSYSNPPSGWLRAPLYGVLKIIGYDANNGPSNSFESNVGITGCNLQYGPAYPCVWLATVYGFVMKNIALPNYGQVECILIGSAGEHKIGHPFVRFPCAGSKSTS